MRLWLTRSLLPLTLALYLIVTTQSLVAEKTTLSTPADPIHVELIQEEKSIQPGHPFWVAIHLTLADQWHTYWKNPGDAGFATNVEWHLPSGFTASPTVWPTPKRFTVDGIIGYGYEGEVLLLTQITPPEKIPSNAIVALSANVKWLVCSDSFCQPGEISVSMDSHVNNDTPQPNATYAPLFKQAFDTLPKKQEGLQAYRKNDLIEFKLKIPDISDADVANIYFCPENKYTVDHASAVTITASPSEPDHYVVVLKAASFEDAKSTRSLKGVMVVNDKPLYSIDIDAPIIGGPDETAIGMTEDSQQQLNKATASDLPETLIMALIFAFIGGMILNLMPCVLPVMSFKILSFVKMAGQSRALTLKHGLVFSLGVLVSFWIIAGILLLLQSYGNAVGWGFQLQEPLFVAALAAVLFVFGLSLFGVFELGASVISLAGKAQGTKEGLLGSFFSGVLATAVATPCTGPFLGSAIGFAVTVSPFQAMLIFTLLGLGMSLPYLVLAAYPNLLRFLPKPGAWMDTFKQVMGFFMLATVLWLIWVFGAQTGSFAVSLLLSGFFCMAIGCWIYGKWGSPEKKRLSRLISTAVTALWFIAGGYAIVLSTSSWVAVLDSNHSASTDSSQKSSWEEFSPEKVAMLQSKGIPVLVDFTAKWCLICQANHMVLSTDSVDGRLEELGVVKMKADWTKSDPMITEELRKHGRNGVPLYLLYGSDESIAPKILPQVLTPDIVLQHLDELAERD